MRIPWTLVGVAAVLLPVSAYVAGALAGSSEEPEQRSPIVVSGTLEPDPGSPTADPEQPGGKQAPGKGTGKGPGGRQDPSNGPGKSPSKDSRGPDVVPPDFDDDDDDDDDGHDGDDEDDDDGDDD